MKRFESELVKERKRFMDAGTKQLRVVAAAFDGLRRLRGKVKLSLNVDELRQDR
jgi:hypothetical protein